jgi:hypothetical protein
MTTFTTEDRERYSKCNPHPDAPHGFMRNESHNAGRYVCECEWWDEQEFNNKRNDTKTDSTKNTK